MKTVAAVFLTGILIGLHGMANAAAGDQIYARSDT